MTQIKAFQVHAFSSTVHGGSPAGVCVLDTGSIDGAEADPVLRRIACDLGPSVTAFVGPDLAGVRRLRWFTREGAEVQSYCGHATFAAAHAVLGASGDSITFETISGSRRAIRCDDAITLEIPIWPAVEAPCPREVVAAIGAVPETYMSSQRDRLLVFASPGEIRALTPDYALLKALGDVGFICSARDGNEVVFRFFCPGFNIGEDEDPATGSAQSTLAPYWLDRLGQSRLTARQASQRGAEFQVERDGDSLSVTAPCATFLEGSIQI